MSSILIEQLLYDISRISNSVLGGEKEKLTYCLRGRGWLLLHALSSSNLRVFHFIQFAYFYVTCLFIRPLIAHRV
jgi:hypothetical protein